jgi:hypothetical protein
MKRKLVGFNYFNNFLTRSFTMVQNYDALDMTQLFEEAERFESEEEGGNNKNFLEKFVIMPEKEGFVVVRLLPPMRGKKFYCATRTHRLAKDPKNPKVAKNFHCPRELVTGKGGKKYWVDSDPKYGCPVCLYTRAIWAEVEVAEGGAVDTKNMKTPEGRRLHAEYSRIKAIERYYYNCVVRHYDKKGNLEKSEGPKILSIGKTLHERIVRAAVGDPKAGEKGLGDISDLKTGRDFKIVKKLRPVTFFPYYDESKFQNPSPLGDKDQIEGWLSSLHDLAALRVLKPVEELDIALQKYTGALPDDDTNFDMSKYRRKPVDLGEQVAATKAAEKVESKPVSAVPSGDDVLAEGEFLKGLDAELKKVQ